MTHDFLTRLLDHNVVFGALIGLESMYVLTQMHQHGIFRLWLALLPLLIFASLVTQFFSAALPCKHLLPFFITIAAATCATVTVELHKKFNRRAHERESSFLFFASITALCIIAVGHDHKSASLAVSLTSALSAWASYGTGLAAFTSLGVRLHPLSRASRLGGIAHFYLTVAIIGLVMMGVMGMGTR